MKQSRQLRKLLSLLPTRLPVGISEFDAWASDIIYAYDLPDNDSIRFALATEILHTDALSHRKPKRFYGKKMLKGAANEIASYKMQEFKRKQQERIAAEKAAEEQARLDAALQGNPTLNS